MGVDNGPARAHWGREPVGSQRATVPAGSEDYFAQIAAFRYGFETPFIPRLFDFAGLAGKRVLEIGVGNGIDGVEIARAGAHYTGLDVTVRHLELTRTNFSQSLGFEPALVEGDLTTVQLEGPFDVVYSFGTLHHIEHELEYLRRIRELLAPDGELRVALYATRSVFNAYLRATWLAAGRPCSFNAWQSHVAERTPIDAPVTIKVRTLRELRALYEGEAGFRLVSHTKAGFPPSYLPFLGKRLDPDGAVLSACGRVLGWYHICRFAA